MANYTKPKLLSSRYEVLLAPGQTIDEQPEEEEIDEKNARYASFLREKERKCGPDGFLDSTRYKHSYVLKREKRDGRDGDKPNTVVDLMNRKERDSKEFDKRLKVIEDHMWQHKQEERELKRVEGDIIKNQRSVRRTLRDFEHAITRKRLAEEKKLNQGLEKYTNLQRQHVHKKEDLTKQRIEASLAVDQSGKDQSRKIQLTTSNLARQYRTKMSELELKKIETERLNREYEARVRKKEGEQFKLKQELAELAISLNMEVQKGRQQAVDYKGVVKKEKNNRVQEDKNLTDELDHKLAKSDGDTKAAEANRRKLSADLFVTRSHMAIKQREEGRHKIDTENRLRGNINEQKALNDAAFNVDQDIKSKRIEQKVKEHENRRKVLAQTAWKEKKEKGEKQESHFSNKFQRRLADQNRREHEDHLKYFQKVVNKGEEQEHNLYNRVKNAEYARQKQEQNVKRLTHKLHEMKRVHAAKLKDEMQALTKEEEEMQQKLIREKASLAKVHAEREETYIALNKHREQLREWSFLYQEHSKEHDRLIQIGNKTNNMNSDVFVTQSYG